jgi:hypothetical protein
MDIHLPSTSCGLAPAIYRHTCVLYIISLLGVLTSSESILKAHRLVISSVTTAGKDLKSDVKRPPVML